jgi:hypothetical protein
MEANNKLENADRDAVFKLADGLGGVTATFFDHHGGPGEEQRVGSVTFPNYEHALSIGEWFYTPLEMARAICHVQAALVEEGLMPCGSCFALSREDEMAPTECPKAGWNQDPYVPIWLAYDDLLESAFDEHGISGLPRARLLYAR